MALATLVGIGGLGAMPAAAKPPPPVVQEQNLETSGGNIESLTLEDRANVINPDRLRDALDDIDFRKPTDVVVYTRNGQFTDDINTKTLKFAQEKHPEWISDAPEDYGDFWDDGLFIITLSVETPNSGQIGTYYGEDRAVTDKKMSQIHAAGTKDFKQGKWTDGVIEVAEKGSKLINQPLYATLGFWINIIFFSGVGAAAAVGTLIVRRKIRGKFQDALKAGTDRLTSVTMDLEETELSARTLPTSSPYAAELEHRFGGFLDDYRKMRAEQDELQSLSKKQSSGLKVLNRAKEFDKNTALLDQLDDAIIAAANLFTRAPGWREAWDLQTAPLLKDIENVRSLESGGRGLHATKAALDSYCNGLKLQIDELVDALDTQRVDVNQALEKLKDMRLGLTRKLEAYADMQIKTFASSESERREMRIQLEESRRAPRRSYYSGSILDTTMGTHAFWSVQSYQNGYRQGTTKVTSMRNRSSSSGGVSRGYSGGGSFSGSGGSSRF